jgi:hypothetical protein
MGREDAKFFQDLKEGDRYIHFSDDIFEIDTSF